MVLIEAHNSMPQSLTHYIVQWEYIKHPEDMYHVWDWCQNTRLYSKYWKLRSKYMIKIRISSLHQSDSRWMLHLRRRQHCEWLHPSLSSYRHLADGIVAARPLLPHSYSFFLKAVRLIINLLPSNQRNWTKLCIQKEALHPVLCAVLLYWYVLHLRS